MDNVKVLRLISGEIVVYKEVEQPVQEQPAEGVQMLSSSFLMDTPYCLIQTHQGVGLAPLMPWAKKGEAFKIDMPHQSVLFQFVEGFDQLVKDYLATISVLEVPPSNVLSLIQ